MSAWMIRVFQIRRVLCRWRRVVWRQDARDEYLSGKKGDCGVCDHKCYVDG